MYGIPGLCHVEAGGFHTSGSICTGNGKYVDAVCPDEFGEYTLFKRIRSFIGVLYSTVFLRATGKPLKAKKMIRAIAAAVQPAVGEKKNPVHFF